jgi:hypothetical protein
VAFIENAVYQDHLLYRIAIQHSIPSLLVRMKTEADATGEPHLIFRLKRSEAIPLPLKLNPTMNNLLQQFYKQTERWF